MQFDLNTLLKKKGYQNKPLSFEEAYLLGVFSLVPYLPELQYIIDLPTERLIIQSIAGLCTFHNHSLYEKENSGEQIAGICAAIFDYDINSASNGFLTPSKDVIDNCGMGGDLCRTPNLSTIAALIAAAGEIPMLKHGSPGNTDNVGSSDFLEYCGVYLFPEKTTILGGIDKYNFAYIDALDENYKRIHLLSHGKAKLAHMNDIIGPITHPINPTFLRKKVLGVNHLVPPQRVAEAYCLLNEYGIINLDHGLFIRGYNTPDRSDGIDEASITAGGTKVVELERGKIESYHLFARDFGLEEIDVKELSPGINKAETSRKILTGEITDGKKDAALANASLLIYLANATSLKKGTSLAREILESKRPSEILMHYASDTIKDKRSYNCNITEDGGK